jgi:hypothetical protein
MRPLSFWSRKAAAFVAAALLASGIGATPAAQAAGVKAPSQDDQVILQLQVKKFRMRNELRGYRTASGTCVDFGDLILALDLPIRLDKKSRRTTFPLDRLDERQWRVAVEPEYRVVEIWRQAGAEPAGERLRVDAPAFGCIEQLAWL